MSLQFILGGSGSGKTTRLYQELIEMSLEHPTEPYFVIVPEQFTMQTQKEIVTLHPNHGVKNIDIVSFQRLAYRIFEELAVETLTVLDDMGKSMVLRKVVGKQKKKLDFFKNQLDKTGFINQLKSMLSELYQYGITIEGLKNMIKKAEDHPLLEQKLKDLLVIYQGFEEYIENRFITTEEILDVLCRVLPESELVKNSVVTLDGYTGFTPVQYRLIELLLQHCKKVMVTVTVDPGINPYEEAGSQDLFHMSRHTVCKLNAIAKEQGVSKEDDIVLNWRPYHRFKDHTELDFLEQNLLRYGSHTFTEEPENIKIYQAANPMEEVEMLIQKILSMIKKEGMRYCDMAVITGDLSSYSKEIIHQFQNCQIPYFLDQKKSIISNPMVELIRSALEVIEKDFSYESIFRYLKTGLVTQNQEMICRIENYVLKRGIRGYKRWNTEWDHAGPEFNELRLELLEPLIPFREELRKKQATVKEMTTAVVALLSELRIEEKMKQLEYRFEEMGQHHLAKEYSQIYGLVMDLADRMVGLLGDESVGKKEYADILDAGFEEIKVGVIPATVDRIVVGDLTRTRMNHIKVLFFLGMNDGVVPMTKESRGVLLDTEREFLKHNKMELAPTAKEDGFMQRFYLYLVLTKPSSLLYLSYSGTSSNGKGIRPSYLIALIRKMFPKLQLVQETERELLSLENGKHKLMQELKCFGGDRSKEFLELYRWFYHSEEYREQIKQLVEAAFYSYQEKGIGQAAAKALYGTVLSGSVTRLEQYAACAYAHFLNYGLELAKRQEYELAAVDIGNLFHHSIDLFFKEMKRQGRDWNHLTEEIRRLLVSQCVKQVTNEYGDTILQSSARNAYLVKKVERITDRTIWALGEQMKKGDFNPVDFEVSFSAIDNLEAMNIRLSEEEQLHLRGRIDRLDLCEDETKVFVKIIDYKSGGTTFDLAALYYGLQLQLVVYMDAVLEMESRKHPEKQVIPAGIFYYNINDPMVAKQEQMGDEEIRQQILKQLKMNGLVNSELEVIRHLDHTIETESDVIPVVLKSEMVQEGRSSVAGGDRFEALRGFVRRKLKGIGKEILNGEAGILPYKQGNRTACDYCPYHAVCGFDLKTSGYGFRKFPALKSEEIWEKIEEGGVEHGRELDEGPGESY